MNIRFTIATFALASFAVGCTQQPNQEQNATESTLMEEAEVTATETSEIESFEIAPGLTARILKVGDGQTAQADDVVEVHYTGWLFDEESADNRGKKFDSSVDRGTHFQFALGAGKVIKGWDQGVEGMAIGEVRELTIAPEMGYGDRGTGGGLIPPGATLVFEVELFATEGPGDSASE